MSNLGGVGGVPTHRKLYKATVLVILMKRNRAYLQFRQLVMDRDNNQCAVCGKGPRYLNLAHILPEEFVKFSLDLNNVLMLCPGHHKLGNLSCHKNPVWFCKWLAKNRPQMYWVAIDRLRELDNDI